MNDSFDAFYLNSPNGDLRFDSIVSSSFNSRAGTHVRSVLPQITDSTTFFSGTSNDKEPYKFESINFTDKELLPAIPPDEIVPYIISFVQDIAHGISNTQLAKHNSQVHRAVFSKNYVEMNDLILSDDINVMHSLFNKELLEWINLEGGLDSRTCFPSQFKSVCKINETSFTLLNFNDVILPDLMSIVSIATTGNLLDDLRRNYTARYVYLPTNPDNRSSSFNATSNPKDNKNITSLLQSETYINIAGWIVYSGSLNIFFSQKRMFYLHRFKKRLYSLFQCYDKSELGLLNSSEHINKYKNEDAFANVINRLFGWYDSSVGLSVFDLKEILPEGYNNLFINSTMLHAEINLLLLGSSIGYEPIDLIKYTQDGCLYVCGQIENHNFWCTQLGVKDDTAPFVSMATSVMSLAKQNARNYYPSDSLFAD